MKKNDNVYTIWRLRVFNNILTIPSKPDLPRSDSFLNATVYHCFQILNENTIYWVIEWKEMTETPVH